jgi:hypothetical protein
MEKPDAWTGVAIKLASMQMMHRREVLSLLK